MYPIIGWPPRAIPIHIPITIPNTFIVIPMTARGMSVPYTGSFMAFIRLLETAIIITIDSCVIKDDIPSELIFLVIFLSNLQSFLLILNLSFFIR